MPKNLKEGTLSDFLAFVLLQNIKQLEGRTLWGHEEEEETLYSKLSEIVIKTQDSNEVYKFFKKKR